MNWQQLLYKNLGDGCKFFFQELKTDAGRRDIPLTDTARKALIKQKEMDLLLGKGSLRHLIEGVSDIIFTNSRGKPFAPNAVNHVLDNTVTKYNKDETGSADREKCEPVLQHFMGHTDIAVTMNIYTDLDFTHIQESVEAVQGKLKIG